MQARHRRAGPFANASERRVVKAFVERLPPSAVVISNLYLPTERDTLEIDVVAITPYGVAVIEVKDWRGRVSFEGQECICNGESRPDPRNLTSHKAKVLYTRLRAWNAATCPIVVMATEATELRTPSDESVPVRPLDRALIEVARGTLFRHRTAGRTSLSESDVEEIADDLFKQHASNHRRAMRDYLLGEPIGEAGPDGEAAELWATEARAPNRRVRLRRHTVDDLASPLERRQQLAQAERGFAALRKLEAKRLSALPLVYACFADPDDDSVIWTAYEGVDGVPLDTAGLDRKAKLRALCGVAEALAACHDEGVIHRALSPGSLLLPEGRSTPVIVNFDLARVVGVDTIAAGSGARRIQDQTRAAPELQSDPRRAGPATDIFALGVVVAEVLEGVHAATASEARSIARKVKPRELSGLLLAMMDEQPSRRPKDMCTVAELLRTKGKI